MNGKTTRTNMNRKFFAMLLIVSLVLSLCAVGFTASADTGAVSPSDAVASDIITATDTAKTDKVTATDTVETDTVSAADTPVVSESEPMMFAAAPAADDIASGECGTCSWIVDAEGVLTIYPTDGTSGTLASGTSASQWPWHSYRSSVTKVVAESGVVCGSSCAEIFRDMRNCTVMNLGGLNTSNVTAMNNMFQDCFALTTLDISNFNTSNATTMSRMFVNCESLITADVSGFDTSNVISMDDMFYNCTALTSLDVSNFKTSKVVNMSDMFYRCGKLTTIDVSKWDTSSVVEIGGMFNQCSSVTSLDVSGFKTDKVSDASFVFAYCRALTSLDLSGWNTSSFTNTANMFYYCRGLTSLNLSGWNTPKVTNMSNMFKECRALTSLDLSGWNTSNVTTMSDMFKECRALTSLDLSGWNTSNVTTMSDMFYYCSGLNEIKITATWKPASDYTAESYVNFFNAVDGKLICTPKSSMAIKSVTVDGEEVEFDFLGGEYDGFTGNSKAVITFAPARTVTFMDNGTQVEQQTVAQGGDAKDPYADESKIIGVLGKHFTGWDKIFTNIQQNLTVYAQYAYNDYVVVFDANGGEGTITPQAFKYGTSQNLSANTFTKEDATFVGWNTAADGSGTAYSDKASVKNLTDEHNATVTLYAQWKDDVLYTVVFDANGGEGTMAPQAFKYGTSQNLSANTFTKEDSSFVGWNTAADGSGTAYSDKASVKNLTDEHNATVTLYAQWKAITYKVIFMDGSTVVETQTVTQGSDAVNPYADPSKIPTYTGKHFVGWDKDITNVRQNITAYAQYEANDYTVVFDANGGEGTMAPQAFKYGTSQNLSANTFTKEDATFAGWNTKADGSGKSYSDKASVLNLTAESGGTVTLYAQWKTPTYTVTFMVPVYDMAIDEIEVEKGDTVIPPEVPGTILGWVTEKNGTTEPDFTNITEDMVVWAILRDPITGTPSVEFEKSEKVFDIGEEINFTAIGVLPEDLGYYIPINGDALYMPMSWSSDDLSGDWDDAEDFDDFGAGFSRDTAGEYVLKVEFIPLIVEDLNMIEGEPVTVEVKYTVGTPTVTVTFEDNGTQVDKQEVEVGGDAVDPYADKSKIPSVVGKHFECWDKAITNIQETVTIYALYAFNDYVLVFDANGGEGEMAPVAFKYETAQELPENTFTREGFTFFGWNTKADLTGDIYYDKTSVNNLTDKHNDTVTFYAQWLINTYSVSFMDSADDSLIEDVPIEYGDSVTAPTVSNVVGWATEKNGTTEADLSKVTGDMTLWAIYRDEYTGAPSVVFDKESKTFDINEEIKFKAVGYWADSSTTDFLDGDERYVPTNWHHAEPSGDFGGKTAPTDDYSASFKQSEAGTYTLKVEFAKSVYADGAWVDDGTVTVESEYKVVAPSAGDTDTDDTDPDDTKPDDAKPDDTDVPKTGDSNDIAIIASNVMFLCAVGMFLTWRQIKSKKENA